LQLLSEEIEKNKETLEMIGRTTKKTPMKQQRCLQVKDEYSLLSHLLFFKSFDLFFLQSFGHNTQPTQ
jgi:hypothetical protein